MAAVQFERRIAMASVSLILYLVLREVKFVDLLGYLILFNIFWLAELFDEVIGLA